MAGDRTPTHRGAHARARRWRLAGAAAVIALTGSLAPGAAVADEQEEDRARIERLDAVRARMDDDARVAKTFEPCPADVFRREAPLWEPLTRSRRVALGTCQKDPAACYDGCIRWSSAAHCFGLARAFQEDEASFTPRDAQRLFSMACATGMGAGCTNRAAGIRNALSEGDPFFSASEEVKNGCHYRSFKIGCDAGDAWGCAMLGQSHHFGEGTPRDKAAARVFYERSCQLSPAFVACEFSKSALEVLAR